MHDKAAAARLMAEVQRLYRERTGEKFTKTGLAEYVEIGRPTLDNWLEKGVMPPVDGMTKLATALGEPAAHLWVRWLDLGMTPALDRIADALERAYPPPDRVEGERRGRQAAQALRPAAGSGSRTKRSAPHGSTG